MLTKSICYNTLGNIKTVIVQMNLKEESTMLENVVEFFKNLPAKQCTECGEKMEEQSECYSNTCEKCNHL